MVSFYDKARRALDQSPPPVDITLRAVFDSLDDGALLQALMGKVHRGCQGYSVKALWYSYLASFVLNLPTVAALIRALENSPALCEACGLNPAAIPSEATYSRFIATLSKQNALCRTGSETRRSALAGTPARLRQDCRGG